MTSFVGMAGTYVFMYLLTVVVVPDDLAPPGVVVVCAVALSRHLKPIPDLPVGTAVYLQGAEDDLSKCQ